MRQQADATAVERVVAAHAQHIVAADRAALQQDCRPGVLQTPEDLYDRLCAAAFEHYAIVGHAKIGLQHIVKIRYFGPTTYTLHHRLGNQDGRWLVLESELV